MSSVGGAQRGLLILLVGVAALAGAQSALASRLVRARAAGAPRGIVPARPLVPGPAPLTASTPANLSYHGGPVMRTNTTYAIYWVPSGYSVSTAYESTINGFFQNVSAASGATTNVYASDTQYSDTTGFIANSSTFGGAAVDTTPFPASGCTDPGGRPVCLTDGQLQSEIASEILRKGWTAGPNKLFFLFTPRNVGSCFSSYCAYTYFCAYHSYFGSGASITLYANQPYAAVPGCDTGQRPNGDDADATINVASHEHNEAITDGQLNAWYDSASGSENGDNCAWTFGSPLGGSSGTYYNQSISTGRYYLQREWSNASSSCVLAMQPGAVTHLAVTGPATSLAGGAVSVTVSARDAANTLVGGYRGSVHFTSSDGGATLPAGYTFTAADNGSHTFTTTVLRATGSQTVSATDNTAESITGTATVSVLAGAVTHFSFTAPATSVSGSAVSVTVRALNAANYVVGSYRGGVHFTSSDSLAGLPGDYAFTAGDNGSHTFGGVTLWTAGSRTLTARDISASTVSGAATISVWPGAVNHFAITGPATSLAGGAVALTVSARDTVNNLVGSYRGAVHLTSSDGAATLPANYTFTAADNGTHAFAVTLRSTGSQTVRTTDTGNESITAGVSVTVQAGAVTHFSVTAPATSVSGSAVSVTVRALNAANYLVGGYRGSLHFTSSDTLAGLPSDYAFTAADNGSHTFSDVTLRSAGSRTLTARDVSASTVSGVATIGVWPGAVTHLAVSGLTSGLAGGTVWLTVTARDAVNNLVGGYRGTVHLTSSDGSATLPANYTFTSTDNGSHAFAIVLRSTGSQTATVTDTGNEAISATASVSVVEGAVTHFSVSGPASSVSGNAASVTVRALNAANYVVGGYRGSVHFTSSDTLAGLPSDYAFTAGDSGSHTFGDVTLQSAGSRTLTVRDISASTVSGVATISVQPGAVTHLAITGPTSGLTGGTVWLTVTARDAVNNLVGSYRGTVQFTSSDGSATLPANYTFTATNNGSHAFAIVLRSTGSQTVTATDTGSETVTVATTVNVT
jgi:hypothetical protein